MKKKKTSNKQGRKDNEKEKQVINKAERIMKIRQRE